MQVIETADDYRGLADTVGWRKTAQNRATSAEKTRASTVNGVKELSVPVATVNGYPAANDEIVPTCQLSRTILATGFWIMTASAGS